MSFPSNLIEFQECFPDEESCWRYLREVRWPDGFECPRCGERESYFIGTRRLEQCRRCRYQAVGDGWDDLPPHAKAASDVVPGRVLPGPAQEEGLS